MYMKPSLNISLIQPNTIWHDTHANIALVDKLISKITNTDLIIMPEMWNTGCVIAYYDKKHLFTLAGEHKAYCAGRIRKEHDLVGWKTRLNVCYDLRFPVWSRNDSNYHLLIYVANWPSPRHHAWRTLLQARAIENQCYVVGSNRVGTDSNGHSYLGGSTVIDYLGQHVIEMDDQEGTQSVDIRHSDLLQFRSKLNFLADRDNFGITQ